MLCEYSRKICDANSLIRPLLEMLSEVHVPAPVKMGDVILKNLVASVSVERKAV
jgi:CxxC motif-containing protein